MTNIEDDLKTLLDSVTWTVATQGVTKLTYVWANSESTGLDLNNPNRWNTTDNQVILVIHPSSRSQVGASVNSKVYIWTGYLKVYGHTPANMKSVQEALDTLSASYPLLTFNIGGVNGSPKTYNYFINVVYQWTKQISY